jgi:surface carbohydrate biosynthesis protein
MGGFNNEKQFLAPHYFTFGEYEKDLLKKHNVKYQSYKAVGSIRFGFFLKKNTRIKDNRSSVCFISQFTSPINGFKEDGVKRLRSVYQNLINWNNEDKKYSIRVALRNGKNDIDHINEVSLFKPTQQESGIELVDNIDYSSYRVGYEALVVVTVDSTLGFELFGSGKKVLFFGTTISDEFSEKENIDYLFRKMPDIVLLDNLTQQDFNNKMNALVNMGDEEYLRQTEAARKYYMKCQKLPPHKIISNFICEKIDNNKINYDTRNR